jgi:lipopolysaccharide transport system ATP-binding protein
MNKTFTIMPGSEVEINFEIKKIPIVADRYSITLYCEAGGQVQDWIKNAYSFDVENADYYQTGKLPPAGHGNILLSYDIEQR